MSSLAQLPEVFGFFSYSRDDDRGSEGRLSNLRKAIQGELSAQLGRTELNFGLFQDQEAIALGKLWETEIAKAIDQAVFFIPIVTPRAVGSPHCKFEFESFLARERALYRDDLIFPILYLPVPELEDEARSRDDPVLSIIRKRQYADWRIFRHLPANMPEVSQSIDRFCGDIAKALRAHRLTPEEREAERFRLAAEEEHHQKEVAEARKSADGEARTQRLLAEDRKPLAKEAADSKQRVSEKELNRKLAEAEKRASQQRRKDWAEATIGRGLIDLVTLFRQPKE
jgi:TIR domain